MLSDIVPSLEIDPVLSFLSILSLYETNESILVSCAISTNTLAPSNDEHATVPLFKEPSIVKPVRGTRNSVCSYCDSEEQQDFIATLPSVTETSLIY